MGDEHPREHVSTPQTVMIRGLDVIFSIISLPPLMFDSPFTFIVSTMFLLQFFSLTVPSCSSFILDTYVLGEVDAFTPIPLIFFFAPHLPFVSLTFPWTKLLLSRLSHDGSYSPPSMMFLIVLFPFLSLYSLVRAHSLVT